MTPDEHSMPELPALVAAQHRAMPFTRLVDYGMDHADARQLLSDTVAGMQWQDSAVILAETQLERAGQAETAGHHTTAHQSYRFAAAAFMFAQMAYQTDTPDKRDLYARHTAATASAAACRTSRGPAVERVTVPYRDGILNGWLCLPRTRETRATVIVWGGLSGWGAAYAPIADAYTARGMACLLAEGPGQGTSRLTHGLYVDERVTDGFARFLDLVEADSRLTGPIGVQGMSFGGLFAAHLAAADSRVAAVVVNGAPATPAVPQFRTAREQMSAVVGTEDLDKVSGIMNSLRFDPDEHRIGCPLLLLHGGRDALALSTRTRSPSCAEPPPGRGPYAPGPMGSTPFTTTPRSGTRSPPTGSPTIWTSTASMTRLKSRMHRVAALGGRGGGALSADVLGEAGQEFLAVRARIVLRCAEGGTNKRVAAELGVSEQSVNRWRARFVKRRLDGLVDEPRPGRPPSILLDQVEDVVVATLESTPGQDTHWSPASMAARTGLSKSTVGRIWKKFDLLTKVTGDNTHRSVYGATLFAELVLGEQRSQRLLPERFIR
ncbi:helix-turn-helix domain-containing protein [Streptomyces sp. NPDC003247]|uniref:helix-turn-helix domain-containing protein n=1 Tax=Streptomyces sp. NPDC003247 TaxID=3364677 RepID=UPI0036CFFD03